MSIAFLMMTTMLVVAIGYGLSLSRPLVQRDLPESDVDLDVCVNEAITGGSLRPLVTAKSKTRHLVYNEDHPSWDNYSATDLKIAGMRTYGWVE